MHAIPPLTHCVLEQPLSRVPAEPLSPGREPMGIQVVVDLQVAFCIAHACLDRIHILAYRFAMGRCCGKCCAMTSWSCWCAGCPTWTSKRCR